MPQSLQHSAIRDKPLSSAVTESDLAYIEQTIKRKPTVPVLAVPARDDAGNPRVIAVYPLMEQAGQMVPFPTYYWLVDPVLHKQLANLERQGVVKQIEQILQDDEELMQRYHNDHRRYINQRLSALPPIDRIRAGDLKTKGIAGIADWNTVKCLHAHLAHELSDPEGNTVAQIIHTRFLNT